MNAHAATLAEATDLLALFADETRIRLTALLVDAELSVAELVVITQLAQSRVSTHLGKLREAEVLRDRREGTSTFYALNEAMPPRARAVWDLVKSSIADAAIASDRKRCRAVIEARKKARGWPDDVAGEMDRHWSPGRTWESLARGIVPLLRLGDVLDVGCGDGAVAQLLAPHAKSIVGVDVNERVIAAAKRRVEAAHVSFEVGDAEALPFPAARFDDVLLFHVLVHAESPSRVIEEAARVVRAHGRVVVLTIDAHDDADLAASFGHKQRGIRAAQLRKLLQRAGLVVDACDVTARERRSPHLQVVTALARKSQKG